MKSSAAFALAGFLAFGVAENATAAQMPTLRYGVGAENSRSLSQLPRVIGLQKGFFAREGLRVEFVTNDESNSTAAAQGYNPSIERGGRADMTWVSTGFFIHSVLMGSDTVAVSAQTANPVYSLIVRPEIRTYADLKGKEITLTALWDTITLTTRKLLSVHGIGRTDFTFRAIRNSDARLECMKAGECAAISAGQPDDIKALKLGLGYHRLGITNEVGPVIFNIEIVHREWAQANRDILVRYLRAAAGAMRFLNDANNRDEIARTVAVLTGEPPEIVDEIMRNYANPALRILPRQAELDMAAFTNLLEMAKEAGLYGQPMPPAERFVDLSYARAAGIL